MNFEINHQLTPASPKKSLKLSIVFLIAVILSVAGISTYFVAFKQKPAPFPTAITAGLDYQVYYPPNNPSGYSYLPKSAKIQAGILFFTLKNGPKKRIFITEQALPSNSINFSSLPKHTSLDVPIGKALIGTGLGNPSIVIITNSTLIQMTSSKGVTQSDVSSAAQTMTQLTQSGNQS